MKYFLPDKMGNMNLIPTFDFSSLNNQTKGHSDLKCNNHFKHVSHLYFAIIFINY